MGRLRRLQRLVAQKKLDALLIENPYNVRYLCGFSGSNGRLLITPRKVFLITDFRYLRMARKWIPAGVELYDQKQGLKKLLSKYKTVGFEERVVTVAQMERYKKALPGVRWKPAGGLAEELRMVKGEAEMQLMRKAVKIAEAVFLHLRDWIRVGVSEHEVEEEMLKKAREWGADGFSFAPIIGFGKNTADVHHIKEDNRLKKGEPVLLDMGVAYKGYMTDMTRMVYLTKPKPIEQKIYTIVREAQKKAIAAVKVGKPLGQIDRVAREHIKKAGYGDRFGHSTGHGIGLEVHEAPSVSEGSCDVIKPGMVFTVEPGIYLDSVGGVRIEDMVYVRPDGGVEVLTAAF